MRDRPEHLELHDAHRSRRHADDPQFLEGFAGDLLNGYTFGDVENSSGKVYDGLGITGNRRRRGRQEPDAVVEHDLTLEPTAPFENQYFAHLMSDPSDNAIKMITFEQLGRMMQTYAAGSVIAFDPITPGSRMPQLL